MEVAFPEPSFVLELAFGGGKSGEELRVGVVLVFGFQVSYLGTEA